MKKELSGLSCCAVFKLFKVAPTFESVDEILKCEATEQYFPVVLFIMLHTDMIPTFEFGDYN